MSLLQLHNSCSSQAVFCSKQKWGRATKLHGRLQHETESCDLLLRPQRCSVSPRLSVLTTLPHSLALFLLSPKVKGNEIIHLGLRRDGAGWWQVLQGASGHQVSRQNRTAGVPVLSGRGSLAFALHKIPVPVTMSGSLHPLHSSDCWGSCSPTEGTGRWELSASLLLCNLQFCIQRAGGLAAVLPGSSSLGFPLKASIKTNLF